MCNKSNPTSKAMLAVSISATLYITTLHDLWSELT